MEVERHEVVFEHHRIEGLEVVEVEEGGHYRIAIAMMKDGRERWLEGKVVAVAEKGNGMTRTRTRTRLVTAEKPRHSAILL